MSVLIKKVESKGELRKFVTFANKLYKGDKYHVPAMPMDEMDVFNPKKNGAYDFCEADCFLAYKDGKIVGRVAAILNRKANAAWNVDQVRFGWIDFIDDIEVSKALLDTVAQWGKERGMKEVVGPLGFTDFDPEGMLIEGFDRLATMSLIHNYPYYPVHMDKLGFKKDTDWVEYFVKIPEVLPERYIKVAEIVKERNKLKVVKKTRKEIIKEKYGQKIFNLINETYCVLYGYSLLSEKQIDQYVNKYLTFLDMKMVSFIENEQGELIATGITMPSLSKALQKCDGRLFPTGWWHLISNLYFKKPEIVDLLLIGVKPEYQSKGVTTLLFMDLFSNFKEMGFKYAESHAELETNLKSQMLWDDFEREQHKRRRAYIKEI